MLHELLTLNASKNSKHLIVIKTYCYFNVFLDFKLRQGVVQSLKLLTTLMNNVQTSDLVHAIEQFCLEDVLSNVKEKSRAIVVAVHRLLRMYCKSALTDFSVQSGKFMSIE